MMVAKHYSDLPFAWTLWGFLCCTNYLEQKDR